MSKNKLMVWVLFFFSGYICAVWAVDSGHRLTLKTIPSPIIALIISNPSLEKYFHPEIPSRVPLIISDHLVASDFKASGFSKAVRIVSDSALGFQPHIRFLDFNVKGCHAEVTLDYKVEGVHAKFAVEQDTSGKWKIKKVNIVEH